MKMQDSHQIPSQYTIRFQALKNRILWRIRVSNQPVIKRAMDIVVVLAAMIFMAPLFLAVALCIRLHDGGPVLYWQNRIGLRGREFPFPKFRSMGMDSDALRAAIGAMNDHGANGITFKMKGDPRITPIGRFIRRFSIDELPQLWCVLTGDMTLVGPRPALPFEVGKYNLRQRERLTVAPGLTCFWQVNGRSEIAFEQQVEMDIEYILQHCLWTDIKILFKTIPAVLFGRGAY